MACAEMSIQAENCRRGGGGAMTHLAIWQGAAFERHQLGGMWQLYGGSYMAATNGENRRRRAWAGELQHNTLFLSQYEYQRLSETRKVRRARAKLESFVPRTLC